LIEHLAAAQTLDVPFDEQDKASDKGRNTNNGYHDHVMIQKRLQTNKDHEEHWRP
jgi:hypothetical protein